jgi:ribosomal protein S18 acetylase RimI-like enzyme
MRPVHETDIRPCRLEECGAVLDLYRRAAALESVTDSLDVLEGLVREHSSRFLVAERNGKIVGSVFGGWDGWRGHIYRLVVDPDERRAGLGRRLVEAAEHALVELGARRLSITVAGNDDRATGFWRAMAASDWQQDEHAVRFTKTLR